MAVVIADTSPLQYLLQVGLIDVLSGLFGTVHVPGAVRDELQVGRSLGFEVPDPAVFSWMWVRSISVVPAVDRFELGAGERAVLALALESSESLVITRRRSGESSSKAARSFDDRYARYPVASQERGLVTAVAPMLTSLGQRGFRVTEAVRLGVLQLAGER